VILKQICALIHYIDRPLLLAIAVTSLDKLFVLIN
jgi:hypothetical protein